jgi:6-phosphogluconolactonase
MNTKTTLKVFETPDLMSGAVAEYIVGLAGESIAAKGKFVIALSGGHTPDTLFTLLSSALFRDRIEWQKTFVFWGDERCVASDDERNNAHQARLFLLDKIAIPASNVYPIPVDLSPAEAAKSYEETLKGFFGKDAPVFDLILLGLGDNGHTASLFPGTPVLRETGHWVKEVYVEEQKEWRITMTVPLINQAHNVAFLVTGKDKAAVLRTVLHGSFTPDIYPAQLVRPADGNLIWFTDRSAASMI